ncbi:MAG: hypothetical protein AB4911_20580 [Oscillochloridaceae bacterium umkhey_bin13]
MAVQGREIPPARRPVISFPVGNVNNLAYIVTGILVLLAASALVSSLTNWGRILWDDMQYGRPRTFHLTANVGRPEEAAAPTHLIAMNLDRQVVIVEIPGGDASKVRAIPGPYLFGAGEDLTPVRMRLADLNGDGVADLVVRVKNEEMVYLNREGAFGLITAEERMQLLRQSLQR